MKHRDKHTHSTRFWHGLKLDNTRFLDYVLKIGIGLMLLAIGWKVVMTYAELIPENWR